MTPSTLWGLSRRELARIARSGHPIDPAALAGHSYRGVSLGLPSVVDRLLWKVFRKRFEADGDGVVGHNVRLVQPSALAPLDASERPQALQRRGQPVTFGPFRVGPVQPNPLGLDRGVLLDYGAAHPAWHPMARIRDVLVATEADRTDLLIGWMYLQLGPMPVSTPSWFTLERE